MSTHAETINAELDERRQALSAALSARGLEVRILANGTVRVRNMGGEPGLDGDPVGQVMAPGLRQDVECAPHNDGAVWWFWAWSGAERDSPPELEPICPAGEIDKAAERIARVLAVPFGANP